MSDPQFTDREEGVLRSIAEGCSNEEIADRLKIDLRTVEFHISRIRRKLGLEGAKNVRRLTLYAYELFPPDQLVKDQSPPDRAACA